MAGDVGESIPDGDRQPLVGGAASDIRRIDQRAAARTQLRDKRCLRALAGLRHVGGLKRSGCGRKVQCRRAADDVGGTRAVDGDAVGPVVRRAVEVARIRQGTRGGELRHERGAEDVRIGIDAGRLERPRRSRECARHGRAGDVGVARRVDSDASSEFARGTGGIVRRAPEICRIHEGGATGVELGHERVGARASGKDALNGVRRREIRRIRVARDVRVALGIDGDRHRLVVEAPAEIRRIEQRGTGGVELDHERIEAAALHGLRAAGDRKVRGRRASDGVRIAGRVDRDAVGVVRAAAADIRRVAQDRIDDQRSAAVIRADAECHAGASAADVTAVNGVASTIPLLVHHGRVLDDHPLADVDHEIAAVVDLETVRAEDLQPYEAGIGARSHDEVVLEAPLGAIEDDVDTGVELPRAKARIRRDVRLPSAAVTPAEIVHPPGKLIEGREPDAWRCAFERNAHAVVLAAHEHPRGTEPQRSSRGPREEPECGVRLAAVLLEV